MHETLSRKTQSSTAVRRLAIITNDMVFAHRTQRVFEAAMFDVEILAAGTEATGAWLRRTFDLVIVDVDASDRRLELCRQLRLDAVQRRVAIIVATDHSSLHADALSAGADESVVKVTTGRELIARANAVLRRAAPPSDIAAYEDDELKVYPDTMRVIRDGQQVLLSKGESDVLALLIRNAPAPLSVEKIREEVSSDPPLSRSAIEARLKGLRRKLGGGLIVNRVGFGYFFHAPRRRRA